MNRRGLVVLILLAVFVLLSLGSGMLLRAAPTVTKLGNPNGGAFSAPPPNPVSFCTDNSSNDGRVNTVCNDPAQPVAIYCTPDGGIQIIPIVTPPDTNNYSIPGSQIKSVIAKVGAKPASNTALGDTYNGLVKLYLLSNGQWLVTTTFQQPNNKPYSFIWNGCLA